MKSKTVIRTDRDRILLMCKIPEGTYLERDGIPVTGDAWEEIKAEIDAFYEKFDSVEYEEEVAVETPPRPDGWIYFFKDVRTNLTKIGYSKQIRNRQRILKKQNPYGFMYSVFEVCGVYKTEQRLHLLFSSKRISGEWFALDDDDLHYIKSGSWINDGRI